MADTKEQFEKVISQCRELFEKKLKDYGPSWRIMRCLLYTSDAADE